MTDITEAAYGVPTTDALLTADTNQGSNYGTTLDLSAGVSNGTLTQPLTGNSLLDGWAQFGSIGANILSTAATAYGSFLESSAVANAANRLNTSPQAVTGALSTVPITPASQATLQAAQNQLLLFAGIGAVVIFAVLVAKKRR